MATKRECNYVNVELDEYNELRDEYNEALVQIEELENIVSTLEEDEGRNVIVRTITYFRDGKQVDVEVKNEEEVKALLDEHLKEYNESLEGKCKNLEEANKAFAEATMKLDMEISRLKHRSLWQRLWNK